jgi:hypothetical protein
MYMDVWVGCVDVIFVGSKSDVVEVGLVPAVLALSKAFGVPPLESAEVLVEGDALVEVLEKLVALGHLDGALDAVGVEALREGPLVGQAGQLVIGLGKARSTRYSWKAKGTSFTRFRWFSGRSRRCMCEREKYANLATGYLLASTTRETATSVYKININKYYLRFNGDPPSLRPPSIEGSEIVFDLLGRG